MLHCRAKATCFLKILSNKEVDLCIYAHAKLQMQQVVT